MFGSWLANCNDRSVKAGFTPVCAWRKPRCTPPDHRRIHSVPLDTVRVRRFIPPDNQRIRFISRLTCRMHL